jgi:predicted nucleic acid-binding protein
MNTPRVFVDTPLLLCGVDDRDITRRDLARAWLAACWTRRCGRLSIPVLNDFYTQACVRFPSLVSRGDARAEVRRYQHWQPWRIDAATIESAWAVEARYSVDYGQALMVAAAQHQGCTQVLTDTLPHALQLDGVQIIDPFNTRPETFLPSAS